MVITRLQWTSKDNKAVLVNGASVVRLPCKTSLREDIESYLSGGGVILPAKPCDDHVYTGVDSEDPSVMYRPKNESEMRADKDATALEMRDVKLVAEAILEAVFDMKQNPGNYQTADSLKLKVRQFYRAKL